MNQTPQKDTFLSQNGFCGILNTLDIYLSIYTHTWIYFPDSYIAGGIAYLPYFSLVDIIMFVILHFIKEHRFLCDFVLIKTLEGYSIQFYWNTFPVFIILKLPSWSDGVSVDIQKRPQEIFFAVDYISIIANQTQITVTYLDVY